MRIDIKSLEVMSSEQEYRGRKNPSYSLLKELDERGPRVLQEVKDPLKGDGVVLGSLVDCLITEPEEVNNKFYDKPIIKPTASLLELSNKLEENLSIITFNDGELSFLAEEYIKDIVDKLDLWSNITNEETKINKWKLPKLINYLKALKEAEGKQILTPELMDLGNKMVKTLKTHEYTKDYFNNTNEDIEIIYQFKNVGTIFGIEVKFMVDLIVVNHKDKTIKLVDLKTSEDKKLLKNYYIYKYYIQAGLYQHLFNMLTYDICNKHGYKLLDFEFVHLSKYRINTPLKYTFTKEWCELSWNGWTNSTGRRNKGIKELIEDYVWYNYNKEFEVEREIVENKGCMEIPLPITI